MRSNAEIFVVVDVERAMKDGMVFYKSQNNVILTVGQQGWLATKYFKRALRYDASIRQLKDLTHEIEVNDAPKWASELAPIGPGAGESYIVKNIEALLRRTTAR